MGIISGMTISVFEDGVSLLKGNNLDLSGILYSSYKVHYAT